MDAIINKLRKIFLFYFINVRREKKIVKYIALHVFDRGRDML